MPDILSRLKSNMMSEMTDTGMYNHDWLIPRMGNSESHIPMITTNDQAKIPEKNKTDKTSMIKAIRSRPRTGSLSVINDMAICPFR
jgi:hypothetical protein